MKTLRLLFTLLFVAAFASVGFGQITGTAHDFSALGWSGGEICMACHTPHNANPDVPVLWNHDTTQATFITYASTTMNAATGQPSGVSKLCLSCHDGTVALDSYGGATGTTDIAARADFGDDLSNDHPISFTYDAALVALDPGLNLPSETSNMTGGTTIDADLLFGGQMECASCHDVHNSENLTFLLKVDNAGSALCLTCHAK